MILNGTANFHFIYLKTAQFGDIESAYAIFHKEYIANELNTNLHLFKVEGKAQNSENIQIKRAIELIRITKKN